MPTSVVCTHGAPRASVARVVQGQWDDQSDDLALMAAITAHADRAAFARVFKRYAPKVKAHLVARGAAAAVADELTQDVMLVLWKKAALFDARRGSVASWLYTISRNCLLNQIRHESRRPVEIDVPPIDAVPATGEQQLAAAESRRTLAGFVEELPEEQREILHAAYWSGMTLQECATERSLPLGTVKTRVRLALGRLRKHLGPGRNE
jgi:RNA polymerase sigma factor (sigma-70 family)